MIVALDRCPLARIPSMQRRSFGARPDVRLAWFALKIIVVDGLADDLAEGGIPGRTGTLLWRAPERCRAKAPPLHKERMKTAKETYFPAERTSFATQAEVWLVHASLSKLAAGQGLRDEEGCERS